MQDKNDLKRVFAELRCMLQPYAKSMDVAQDTDGNYLLNTRHLMPNKKPLFFAGVRMGKNYVSYLLMSVYTEAQEMKSISPELKKRMQGKSCFNFKRVDAKLFSELAKLTKSGARRFNDEAFVEQLRRLWLRK